MLIKLYRINYLSFFNKKYNEVPSKIIGTPCIKVNPIKKSRSPVSGASVANVPISIAIGKVMKLMIMLATRKNIFMAYIPLDYLNDVEV